MLLSSAAGAPFADVQYGGALYEIAITAGPGGIRTHRSRDGMIAIGLRGTTQDTQVTVTTLFTRRSYPIKRLAIGAINVRTGRLGSIQGLTSADLMGPVSPLSGIVNSLQFDSLGPAAQINVTGNLGQLTVNQGISLGTKGLIDVSGNLTGGLSATRDVDLAGGRIVIGQDLSGTVAVGGNLALSSGGQFSVGRNLGATASGAVDAVTGNLSVDSGGQLSVGGNLSVLSVGGNVEASGNGKISIAGILTTFTINGGGGSSATGNATFSGGGQLVVGQNLGALAVGSNIATSTGGGIQVGGNLGTLTVGGSIAESTGGAIAIATDLTGSLAVAGSVLLNGGTFSVGRDLSGSVTVTGNLGLANGGQFTVGRNLTATASGAADTVSGNLTVDSSSGLSVGGNLGALSVGGNLEASGNGHISVSGNVATLSVNGGGGSSATGNVTLSSGGRLVVGQNLTTLSVGSNLQTSGGGGIQVGADLGSLVVTGMIQGKGSGDLVVGVDLGQLTVLGGGGGVASLTDVVLNVSDDIQGLDIRNGISDSLITAGILINGGTPSAGSNGWNIGPNGHIAVFDSQILAGTEIDNLVIGGDVKSDAPTKPAGQAARIVAGEDPQGTYAPSGIIDNFQIVGNLVDAVLASSVEPYSGTYPEPAPGPNSTAPPFANPTIPSIIVLQGGAINPSFVTASGSPTKLTVTGAVISSDHADTADFAGIFAQNTAGVKVGTPST